MTTIDCPRCGVITGETNSEVRTADDGPGLASVAGLAAGDGPSAAVREWYVTFGEQYRYERHPSFPVAHPDGYLVVRGPALDEESARAAAVGLCGTAWSLIYGSLSDLNLNYFPMGTLATLTVTPEGHHLSFSYLEYRLPAVAS